MGHKLSALNFGGESYDREAVSIPFLMNELINRNSSEVLTQLCFEFICHLGLLYTFILKPKNG